MPWEEFQSKNGLTKNQKFKWMQLIHSIPSEWKTILLNDNGNSNSLVFFNHHLIKNTQVCSLEKLNFKELYIIQILNKNSIPTCQTYYKELLEGTELEWKYIYILPRIVTTDNKYK